MDHNKHDVKTIETKEVDLLKKESQNVKKTLEAKLHVFFEAKKCVAQRTDICVMQLEKTKDKVVKCIDEMIKKANNQKNRTDQHVDKPISHIKKNIELLSHMEDQLECETIPDYREKIRGIIEEGKKDWSGARSFKFPVFDAGEDEGDEKHKGEDEGDDAGEDEGDEKDKGEDEDEGDDAGENENENESEDDDEDEDYTMTIGKMTSGEFLAVLPNVSADGEDTQNQLLPRGLNAFQLKCAGAFYLVLYQ